MEPSTTILVTVHGSHLYGLDHSKSDVDFFRVVASREGVVQWIRGEFDYTEFGLDKFLENVFSGSHQSCEALFSPRAFIHPQYRAMFAGLRVTGADAFAKYRRTIKAFSYGDVKQRRHAVRLGFALQGLRREGRFNPALTEGQINSVKVIADLYRGQSLYDVAINL